MESPRLVFEPMQFYELNSSRPPRARVDSVLPGARRPWRRGRRTSYEQTLDWDRGYAAPLQTEGLGWLRGLDKQTGVPVALCGLLSRSARNWTANWIAGMSSAASCGRVIALPLYAFESMHADEVSAFTGSRSTAYRVYAVDRQGQLPPPSASRPCVRCVVRIRTLSKPLRK